MSRSQSTLPPPPRLRRALPALLFVALVAPALGILGSGARPAEAISFPLNAARLVSTRPCSAILVRSEITTAAFTSEFFQFAPGIVDFPVPSTVPPVPPAGFGISRLFSEPPPSPPPPLTNKIAETTSIPGPTTVGIEVVLGIFVTDTGHTFVTGPGGRNVDGKVHALITEDFGSPGHFTIGFEDIHGLGDRDFDDAVLHLTALDNTNRPCLAVTRAFSDLIVTKEPKPGQPAPVPGGTFSFIIRVKNVGAGPTPPPPTDVTLRDDLSNAGTLVFWTASAGVCSNNAPFVDCSRGMMGPGEEWWVEIGVRIPRNAVVIHNAVVVDRFDRIPELDELNNSASLTVNVN